MLGDIHKICINYAVWSKQFPLFTLVYSKVTCIALSHQYIIVKRNQFFSLGCYFFIQHMFKRYVFLEMRWDYF